MHIGSLYRPRTRCGVLAYQIRTYGFTAAYNRARSKRSKDKRAARRGNAGTAKSASQCKPCSREMISTQMTYDGYNGDTQHITLCFAMIAKWTMEPFNHWMICCSVLQRERDS